MSKAKLAAARELIQEKDFSLARSLLRTVKGDPTAAQWLAKLDEIAPEGDLDDPFAGISQPPPKQELVRYERKTISINAGHFENLDKKVDKRINQMEMEGWEYVDQKEKVGGLYAKGRVIEFRRPRK
jgi:hypothetical protein